MSKSADEGEGHKSQNDLAIIQTQSVIELQVEMDL